MRWALAGAVVMGAALLGVVAWGVHLQRAQPAAVPCAVDARAVHLDVRALPGANRSLARYDVVVVNPTDEDAVVLGHERQTRIFVQLPDGALRGPSTTGITTSDFFDGYQGTPVPAHGEVRWVGEEGFAPDRLAGAATYLVEQQMDGLCGLGRVVVPA